MARAVAVLENILKRYGVAADYWPLDESVPAPEKGVEREGLRGAMLCASPNVAEELLAALERTHDSGLSLDMALGDVRAEEGQVEAALKAYELAVLEEDDPTRLCELGYLLLQRCRVDELPLCDKDFDGVSFDCPSGETVSISAQGLHFDNAGPEFPVKRRLLDVAISAFGRAYVRCMQRFLRDIDSIGGDRRDDVTELLQRMAVAEDKWHQLVALDGLRAAFMEADDLDGLDSVVFAYHAWVEDYKEGFPGWEVLASKVAAEGMITPLLEDEVEPDPESPFYDFELRFFGVRPWVRARRKAPPVTPDALRPRDVRAAEDSLRGEHGDRYLQLPGEVRRLLAQAQFQQSLLRGTDADWAAVANWYGRAVETLLRRSLGPKLDAQGLHSRFNEGHPYARGLISHFVKLFNLPQFGQLGPAVGISQAEASMLAELAPDLETVASIRNPAVHGDERTLPVRALKLRALVLGAEGQGGLLWKISSLCTAR
jgi:hypothetical protein